MDDDSPRLTKPKMHPASPVVWPAVVIVVVWLVGDRWFTYPALTYGIVAVLTAALIAAFVHARRRSP